MRIVWGVCAGGCCVYRALLSCDGLIQHDSLMWNRSSFMCATLRSCDSHFRPIVSASPPPQLVCS